MASSRRADKAPKKAKAPIGKYIVGAVVICVLLCGIFAIGSRLIGGSGKTENGENNNGKAGQTQNGKAAEEKTTEVKADNSNPMTKLTVTAPAGYLREGETMKLDIKYEPKDASNPTLKWTCSEDGLVSVSEDGELVPEEGSGKHTVTMTAESTDGSGLSESFELMIYPKIDPEQPMVAITFDDGPNPDTTNVMLDALEENYAKATFFCLGQNAGYYPEVVKREYDLGMEVGTHTFSHVQLTKLSGDALDEEISKSVDAIKEATGVKPVLMRPPYGAVNKTVLKAVGGYGLCCMNWSLDTEDWKTKKADATYAETMKAVDGDVVLLHDIHEYNVDAVKRFVPDLMAQGFQLVTVSELYKNRGETLDPGTLHFRTDPTTESAGETTAADADDPGAQAETTEE